MPPKTAEGSRRDCADPPPRTAHRARRLFTAHMAVRTQHMAVRTQHRRAGRGAPLSRRDGDAPASMSRCAAATRFGFESSCVAARASSAATALRSMRRVAAPKPPFALSRPPGGLPWATSTSSNALSMSTPAASASTVYGSGQLHQPLCYMVKGEKGDRTAAGSCIGLCVEREQARTYTYPQRAAAPASVYQLRSVLTFTSATRGMCDHLMRSLLWGHKHTRQPNAYSERPGVA